MIYVILIALLPLAYIGVKDIKVTKDCTGVGDSITEAKDNAYDQVEKIKVGNDMGYRTDIGNRCEEALKKLKKFGYCTDWKF